MKLMPKHLFSEVAENRISEKKDIFLTKDVKIGLVARINKAKPISII